VTHPLLADAPMNPDDVARQFLYGVVAANQSC
jgi:hypothetical protein